jgi:hypothetical protein
MSPFIHRCQCLRGFFVLRPCDAETAATCPRCQRHVCRKHLGPVGVCAECAARADEDRLFMEDDDGWFYRQRHEFYIEHHYRPVYWGTGFHGGHRGYDAYDFRSFDQRATDDPADPSAAVLGGALEDS